ncbi:glutamate 5-kinase [Moraxella caviae]|uniref:Glutamate 5-kinase n=1 Tax=Moraxella caviae TaxID=34060 RepID=A0A1S9ZT59_9GAMM|nr:glutamate 5-kinase [Moraxella caviae]OOR86638.1 glutamate 5-kinase [Moraxella caviae]STZ14515.1 Uncharacterised protein [Moraxella caviae]VEW11305.1 Uncharacterised protein [Moraxella caviae]
MNNEITNEIATAFDSDLKDAVKPFTGERNSVLNGGLDDWLGESINTATAHYSGRGVFSRFSAKEVNDTILASDVKLICLQSEVSDTPQIDDVINGFRVVAINKDPADVSYTIQLRQV